MELKESKNMVYGIWVFSIVVYAVVVSLHYLPEANSIPSFVDYLPLVNACINGICTVLLVSSLLAVKNRNFALHQRLNTTAMIMSFLFLVCYIINHYFKGDSKYGGDMAGVFYFILITHILLAGLSLPFILLAYYRGLTNNIQKHKKLVRFTYPVWLYVTITGVLVYVFMAPYYS